MIMIIKQEKTNHKTVKKQLHVDIMRTTNRQINQTIFFISLCPTQSKHSEKMSNAIIVNDTITPLTMF